MQIQNEEKLEKSLSLISNISIYFQCIALAIVCLIIILKPFHYQEIIKALSICFIIISAVISRVYIQTGKKLEAFKTFSPKEREFIKKEYFFKFFMAYPLWGGIFAFFSM